MNAVQTNPTAQLLAALQALSAEYGNRRLLLALPQVFLRKAKPPRPPDAGHLPAHMQRDIGLIDVLVTQRKD
jgi:hypothetical protein